MDNLNVTVFQGRIVREPTIRNNGTSMVFFSVGSNHRPREEHDVLREETTLLPCKCIGKWTETLAPLKKGDMVIVAGRLRSLPVSEGGPRTSRPQLILVCNSIELVSPTAETEPHSETSGTADPSNGEPTAVTG